MNKIILHIFAIALFAPRGICDDASPFDAVIESLVLSEEFGAESQEKLAALPAAVIPVLAVRLKTPKDALYESRLYFCLTYKVKQYKDDLDQKAMTDAVEALAEKCRGREDSVIPRLRLLKGIRHPKVRDIAEKFAKDSRPNVKRAAEELKVVTQ